jgi:hypothetical protein
MIACVWKQQKIWTTQVIICNGKVEIQNVKFILWILLPLLYLLLQQGYAKRQSWKIYLNRHRI